MSKDRETKDRNKDNHFPVYDPYEDDYDGQQAEDIKNWESGMRRFLEEISNCD